MKVIIAGCRDMDNVSLVYKAIENCGFKFTQIVSGGASGVDTIGENLAMLHGYSVKVFPAEWRKHGNAAGPIRNKEMAEYADGLLAVWDGSSKGTKNMISQMQKLNKPVYVYMVKKNENGKYEKA